MSRVERVAWMVLAMSFGYLARYCEDCWHLWREVHEP